MEILCYLTFPWTNSWKYVSKIYDKKRVSLVHIDWWKSDIAAFLELNPGSMTNRHPANRKTGSPFVSPGETNFCNWPLWPKDYWLAEVVVVTTSSAASDYKVVNVTTIPFMLSAGVCSITVMSNERQDISIHPPIDCLLKSLKADIKENFQAPHHWPFVREYTSDRWIPFTKGQWCGKRFSVRWQFAGRYHWREKYYEYLLRVLPLCVL